MAQLNFTSNDKILIFLLSLVQFTVVLDFAVLAPLGAQLMRDLDISAAKFSIIVSAYAISAGVSGFLLAGISDKYDRKKLLIVMYIGFVIGTFLCAIANSYYFLLIARIVAGIFGGVMSGISFAIVTDIFRFQVRGTVMGFIQMAFSASQILGIPVGLYLAHIWSWNAPFYIIVGIGIINICLVLKCVPPINAHLGKAKEKSMIQNVITVFKNPNNLKAYAATFFLSTGGYLLMPFSSPFMVYNIGIKESQLALVFLVAGLGSLFFTPLFGWLSDQFGKFKIFAIGSSVAAVFIYFYTNLGTTPLLSVILLFTGLTIAVSSRMSSSSALISAVPEAENRGAFMNINSSIQQMSGGIATLIAGTVLVQNSNGSFANFHILGLVAVVTLFICVALMSVINKIVLKKENLDSNESSNR